MGKKKSQKPSNSNLLKCKEGDGTYDHVTATIDCDRVHLDYRVTGLSRDGHDGWEDDNLCDWTEEEIQQWAGNMLGIVEEDHFKIDVCYA